MSENVGTIYYEVEADTSKLLSAAAPAEKSMDGLIKTFDRTDKAANQANFQMKKTAEGIRQIGNESKSASGGVSGLYGALAGLVTLRAAGSLVAMADAYNEMAERITMATSSAEEYDYVQQRLLQTANGTYRALTEAQELYVLTSGTLRALGYDTNAALDIVDSLSYAFVKNATSVDRADSTINAITKSLNKGTVDAEAWQTILAAIPSVVDDFAEATGRSVKEVLELGAAGKIAGRDLSETLKASLDENKKAADGMSTTVKDAFTNLRNNLSVFIGESNRATGSTQLLSSAILSLGNNIDTIVKLLMVAGAGALARYIAQMGASVVSSAAASMAARAQAIEQLKLAQAHTAAAAAAAAQATSSIGLTGAQGRAAAATEAHTAALARQQVAQAAVVGVGGRLLTLLGGPVGIVALIASAAAGVFLFGKNSSDASVKVDDLADSVEKLGKAQLDLRRQQAGEAVAVLEKNAKDAGNEIQALEKDYEALSEAMKKGRGVDQAGLDNVKKTLVEQRAAQEAANAELAKGRDIQKQLTAEAERRANVSTGSTGGGAAPQSTPDGSKYIENLNKENALMRKNGEERVKLKVLQDLQGKATEQEIALAQQSAVEQFRLTESQKAVSESTKQVTKDTASNSEALGDLAAELMSAGLSARELAQASAESRLNVFATPDQIAAARELAGAIYDVAQAKIQAEDDKAVLAEADPIGAEIERYEELITAYDSMLERKKISDDEYLEYKLTAEMEHDALMLELEEQRFRRSSEWNDFMMTGIETFGAAATNSLAALVSGTGSASDAAKGFANTILKEVIGSFVQMGVAHVKAILLGRAAESAAGAAYAGAVASQVTATTALAAQAAFASTAAIPIVGPFLAPAAAALAATAAGSLGAPAVAAAAGAAGRQYGGPVDPSSMYRINENGAPEVYNAANGQQYMLPNTRGEVVSNADATSQSANSSQTNIRPQVNVYVNLNTSWPPSDNDVRTLVDRLNDAVSDGMVIARS